jgi:endonuclease/exonuclease/phosphatase family metal-dependent hydrolase
MSPEEKRDTVPGNELLIVTANLQQGRSDPSSSKQMQIFANRVTTLVPFAPDVLLLQEVSGESAVKVANLLRRRTTFNYQVAIGPQGDVVQKTDDVEEVIYDSAIVLNSNTMESVDDGGVITNAYDPIDAFPGVLPRTKQHSFMLVRKRIGGVPVALASIHFVTSERLALKSLGFCYKNKWTREVTDLLFDRYPIPDHAHVVAGDFNNPRCLVTPGLATPEAVKCEEWPFWNAFTSRAGYNDAILSVHGSSDRALHRQARRGTRTAKPRIDFVFTTANVLDASHDVTYGAFPGEPGFYSDHRFLWARIDLPDPPPPVEEPVPPDQPVPPEEPNPPGDPEG